MGEIPLDLVQAKHARNVLRLEENTVVEVFDDRGRVAAGRLIYRGPHETLVLVESIESQPELSGLKLTIASAIPKGERADWMIEKLSELGVFAFIPLQSERSVVKPEGKNKIDRWNRIATESAKQSRRLGVMRIGELMTASKVIEEARNAAGQAAFYLSTQAGVPPIFERVSQSNESLLLLIGPEGGWTEEEIRQCASANIEGVGLTQTILRIETAAVVAAGIALSMPARSS